MQVPSEISWEWNEAGDLTVFLHWYYALNFNELFLIYPWNENHTEKLYFPEMALEVSSAHPS